MESMVERGSYGRTVSVRLAPNEDVSEAIGEVCRTCGITHAVVRSGVGSLIDGCIESNDGSWLSVQGPAVEMLSLTGDVRPDDEGRPRAHLIATVGDPTGNVLAGRLAYGQNRICVTAEVVLQEWLPAATA